MPNPDLNPFSTWRSDVVFPDGVTLHRAGEFFFSDRKTLERLYSDNPLQYQDAITKLLQMLGTSGKISATRIMPLFGETTSPLLEKLATLGRLADEPKLTESEIDTVRGIGLAWLNEHRWKSICEDINEQRIIREALQGHLWRDFQLFWAGRRLTPHPDNYVDLAQIRRLPANLSTEFVECMERFASQHGITSMPGRNELELWINRALTTHFVIFGEYWQTKSTDYVPSLTRSRLSCLRVNLEVLPDITTSIAAKVLQDERISRFDLLERAIEWTERGEGRSLFERYSELRQIYRESAEPERRDLDAAIQGIREKDMRYSIFFVMRTVEALSGKGPQSDPVMRHAKSLRWLFGSPDKFDLQRAVRALIEK